MRISLFDRLLWVLFLFIGIMIAARIAYSGSTMYMFMVWNLFLAWLPYVLSKFFMAYSNKAIWKQLVLFCSWLVFFPNALYIITDLIHLQKITGVPVWYDAVLVFASSFAGLILAFISLQKAEHFLSGKFSKRMVIVITAFILFLGGFGVYLGRFLRWNSWNVLNSPVALAEDIFAFMVYPHLHLREWIITIILSVLYAVLYYFLKILPQALSAEHKKSKK